MNTVYPTQNILWTTGIGYEFQPSGLYRNDRGGGRGYTGSILAKDMSRLGRDYLQVGFYTDNFFPEHNIRFIALAREYMGDTVNFKTYSKSFKNKRRYENPEENHAIFENTHEAIIDRQTWEMVQRIRAGTKRSGKPGVRRMRFPV